MESTIAPLLSAFPERQSVVKDELRTCAECDPEGFRTEVLPVIQSSADGGLRRYLVQLLLKYSRLFEYIADPAQSDPVEAEALARAIVDLGVPLDTGLEAALSSRVRGGSAGASIVRVIDLLSALSLGRHILQFQEELIAHPDPLVRSKAALEVGRFGKSLAWVTRMLMQSDPNVQANAVEATWDFVDQNVRPVLLIAARSPHGRVAANGLLGLYRHGALDSIPLLLRMASHTEASHRENAILAIGETGDSRFLPFLTQGFAKAEGKEKQCIVRALARIRKQIRASNESGEVRITVLEARVLPSGERRIVLALWSRAGDLSSLSPMRFALWENQVLVTDYSTRCVASPPLLILGFALPRFTSKADPYAQAVTKGLNMCAEYRRSKDLWRVDRFLIEGAEPVAPNEEPSVSVVDSHSALALHMRSNRGFVTAPEMVRKVIEEPGPREQAAPEVTAAVNRLVEVTARVSGPRHLFVFFDAEGAEETRVHRVAKSLEAEPITIHGFAAEGPSYDEALLRELCEATNGGYFRPVPLAGLPEAIMQDYLGLIDRYEITYKPPADGDKAASCELHVATPSGCAESTIPFSAS